MTKLTKKQRALLREITAKDKDGYCLAPPPKKVDKNTN